MLPLWIIDLTKPTDRQSHFKKLVSRLQGVLMDEDASAWMRNASDDSFADSDEKKQWLYTQFDNLFTDIDQNDAEAMSSAVYEFQELVVKSGQQFVKMLRHSNIDSSVTLNVCVLGDSTEEFSKLVFPSIAVMLQKEKGRILPNHIHQGLSIVGAYYIPSNVNSLDVEQRQAVYLSLREIDVQHNISTVRGYDRMFYYQDIQNRTECYFPLLSKKEQAEYIFQAIIHLYYACDKIHPLISGSSSDDRFYFSLGCSSAFFDTEVQDRIDNLKVYNSIVEILSKEGDLEKPDEESQIIDFEKVDAEQIIMKFQNFDFDISQAKLKEPTPHPINDFSNLKLKKLYYQKYLKYYPANLRLKILDVISQESESVLEDISSTRKLYQNIFAETTLPVAIEKQLMSSDTHQGCLTRIVRNLKSFKTQIGIMKGRVDNLIEQNIWHYIIKNNVPKSLKDDFEAYHEAYCDDLEDKRLSKRCEEMKQTALKDFVNILKQEATFMGRLGRAFLLGIMLVLSLMPIITLISQDLIDLGNVKANALYWSAALFIIPLILQFISMALYYRKKNQKERRMKAYYLHDAYARIANRIETESYRLYDYMVNLCDEYQKRCKLIEKEIRPAMLNDIYAKTELPITLFNQPVVGGSFAGNIMMTDLENESREIYVQRVPRRITLLDEEDSHLLLHTYKEELKLLFNNVKVREKHERKFDDELGYKVFLSRDEQDKEDEQIWTEDKTQFKESLKVRIEKDMLPRKNPTIGEKVWSYVDKMDNDKVLEPLICAAATNGELTSTANLEHGDVKSNEKRLQSLFENSMPTNATQFQFDTHKNLLHKYMFVTRWKTFDSLALNRILPSEDFDMHVRKGRVNADELSFYKNASSSIILWSICQNDNSSEWLKLFDGTSLSASMKIRDTYIKKLNTKD